MKPTIKNGKPNVDEIARPKQNKTEIDRTIGSTPRAAVTVIASAICSRDICSRNEQLESREIDNKSRTEDGETWKKMAIGSQRPADRQCCPETLTAVTSNAEEESRPNLTSFAEPKNLEISEEYDAHTTARGEIAYPPFPCPFCDRAYASWGFRRRHIKAVHTLSPRLNCKWCSQVLPNHAAWRRHVISDHNLSAGDAHNGLLILEEAHMVLQIAHPTRLDTLVNIIKQNSQRGGKALHDSESQPD